MRDEDRPPVLAHQRFDAARGGFAGLGLAARFRRIHETNLWGAPTSVSGLGSEDEATSALQAALPTLLEELGVSSLIDAPCGDAGWIGKARLNVEYVGVDIVPELIEAARTRAGQRSTNDRFLVADIVADVLPRADVVLCRDCLVHLSFNNIALAVENFRRSGATWLITTTFSEWTTNADAEDGDWRPLNFMRPPFNWPKPHQLINEGCDEADGGYRDKCLGVWRLTDIPPRPAVRGLNHLTLAVADLARSMEFYRDVLGFHVRASWPTGAYLEAGSLWLCLSVDDGTTDGRAVDYTHFALDVAEAEFDALAKRVALVAPEWRTNRSEGRSLYIVDPDGHRLELHVGNLRSRLAHYKANLPDGMKLFQVGSQLPDYDPEKFGERLPSCWSVETASTFSEANPAMGQCSVTALVAQDFLGGDIAKTQVDGAWHYYNILGAQRWDFTASQFAKPLRYDDVPSSREDALTDTTSAQYQKLSEAIRRER